MKKTVFKKTIFGYIQSIMAYMLLTVLIAALMMQGLNQAEAAGNREGLHILEDSLMRAAIKCYAVEGRYPDNLAYIEQSYGVHVDKSRYVVHYDIFASNLLPDITVLEIRR